MRKRRKVLVILGLIALAAVCFVILTPRDEPKYQGRSLSEWMEAHQRARSEAASTATEGGDPNGALMEMAEAAQAVQAIGTNALPYFVGWLREVENVELLNKLPAWIRRSRAVKDWFVEPAFRHFYYANNGFKILGTNAVSAIPELKAMMADRTRPRTAGWASAAIRYLGIEAIPVLQEALADPTHAERGQIVWSLGQQAQAGHTNVCVASIIEALADSDESVRQGATNALLEITPQFFTGSPAN